jgi:hypothetical protein
MIIKFLQFANMPLSLRLLIQPNSEKNSESFLVIFLNTDHTDWTD